MVGIKFKEINKGEHLLFESNDTVVEYYDSLVNIPIVGFVTSSAFDNTIINKSLDTSRVSRHKR